MEKPLSEKREGPPCRPEKQENSGCDRSFKGVRMRKWGKWVAEVRLPKSRKRIWLGSYDTQEKAARAYDAAVFCLRGPTAKFNFPETPPQIPSAASLTPVQIQAAAARYANEGESSSGSGGDGASLPLQPQLQPQPVVGSNGAEGLLEGVGVNENLPLMETFLPDSGNGMHDMGIFSSFENFPADPSIPAEDEEDETSAGAFFQLPRLWNF